MEDMPFSKTPPVNKQVVIGTPGTINKWFTGKKLGMSAMTILVFDEADHMLAEGGFKLDSERIMKGIVKIRPNCQNGVMAEQQQDSTEMGKMEARLVSTTEESDICALSFPCC
ncbi:hypothetical protein AgCh_024591 [Apium graveolens]